MKRGEEPLVAAVGLGRCSDSISEAKAFLLILFSPATSLTQLALGFISSHFCTRRALCMSPLYRSLMLSTSSSGTPIWNTRTLVSSIVSLFIALLMSSVEGLLEVAIIIPKSWGTEK